MTKHYDIIIGGGGMVGSSLALATAPLGLNVAVVEPVEAAADTQPSFDERSTALSRSTQRMFGAMGLWDEVRSASTPIKGIHVSDKGRFGFSHIDAEEQGVEALGHVVINRVLGGVLRKHLETASHVDWICPARIEAIDEQADGVSVSLDNGDSLSGGLLVAADGARSSLRALLGIGVDYKDYGQTAVIGNLQSDRPAQGIAYERFTEEGPLAFLPISGGRVAFVWVCETASANQLLDLDDEDFVERIHDAFGHRLGSFSKVGKRSAYPLILSKASRLRTDRCVLVGNSAHGLHPVAAQGFNLGLRDVAALCDCLKDHPGDVAAQLEHYRAWRKQDQGSLVKITDGLVELFRSDRAITRGARNVGMLAFDMVPGVRRAFARQMMGLNGRLPRLSRGVPLS